MSSRTTQLNGKSQPPDNLRRAEHFLNLSQDILSCSSRGEPRITFLKEVSRLLLEFSRCDAIELRHRDGEITYRWEVSRYPESIFDFEILSDSKDIATALTARDATHIGKPCRMVISKIHDPNLPYFTPNGSFWTNETCEMPDSLSQGDEETDSSEANGDKAYHSLAIIPFEIGPHNTGVLLLKSEQSGHFAPAEIESYELIAQTLGLAAADRDAQAMVRERVKELTCLYGIAQIADNLQWTREEKLQRIANLLPPSWQHPEIAVSRIDLDGHTYLTSGYRHGRYRQTADIVVRSKKRGIVEVAYTEGKPELLEGPFLKEETSLIVEVARRVAAIVEREETEADRLRLQEQLKHADRLATIGQLAASVAHELNEPLSSVLGFAQLAKKNLTDSQQVGSDLDKIVKTALHAREVIRKLVTFARQMPPKKTAVDVNYIVNEAVSLFELRCNREGIKLVQRLADRLPTIEADPMQISQSLINLVVNAIQAMPQGGTLTIQTTFDEENVSLIITDTGVGMDANTKRQIFDPFFTTKDVRQGTGLGLSVVQGIVTSHGGSIHVKSSIGRGSRFEVRLPIKGMPDHEERV